MDDHVDLVSVCRRAEAACERHRQEQLSRAGYPGIRRDLASLLHRLAEQETTIGALAAALHITVHDAAQRAGCLEARGYLRRAGRHGDIRDRTVELTSAGQAAAEADRGLDTDLERRVGDRLGANDLAAAQRVLATLAAETHVTAEVGGPY